MWHYRGGGEVHAAVGWENLTNRSLGRPRHRWEDNNILECILKKRLRGRGLYWS